MLTKTEINKACAELLYPECSVSDDSYGAVEVVVSNSDCLGVFDIYDESSSDAYRIGELLKIALNPDDIGGWIAEDIGMKFVFKNTSQFKALIKCIEAHFGGVEGE